jgi:hypothetical protein
MAAEKETAGVLGRPHHLDGTKALDHAKSQGNPYVIRLFDNYHQIYKYQRDIIGKDYMPKNQYAKDSTGPGVKGTRIYVPVQTQIVRIFFKIVGAGAVCTVAIGIWSWLRHPLRPAVEVEYQRWRRRQPRRWLWRWLSGRFCYRCRQAWMRYARFIDSGDDEQNDFNLEVDRLWQWLARLLPRIAQWHLDILARNWTLWLLSTAVAASPAAAPATTVGAATEASAAKAISGAAKDRRGGAAEGGRQARAGAGPLEASPPAAEAGLYLNIGLARIFTDPLCP